MPSAKSSETLPVWICSTFIPIFSPKRITAPLPNCFSNCEIAVSNALAAWLIGQGVKENNFVALRMGRVKEFAAAVVGVHKAGAAYVPVDPEYPEDRISFMLEDSEA